MASLFSSKEVAECGLDHRRASLDPEPGLASLLSFSLSLSQSQRAQIAATFP